MHKRTKYTLLIVVVVILSGYVFIKQMDSPEPLVKKTIEQATAGNVHDLPLSEENKNKLLSFFTDEVNPYHAKSTIRLINKTNKTSEFLVSLEQINYTENNEIEHIKHGSILIQVEQVTLFQYRIANVDIQRKFE